MIMHVCVIFAILCLSAFDSVQIKRVCRTCKLTYDPSVNAYGSCRYHSGKWLGAELSKHYGTKSGGEHRGLSLSWDCCDNEDINCIGCKRGNHISYDDISEPNIFMNTKDVVSDSIYNPNVPEELTFVDVIDSIQSDTTPDIITNITTNTIDLNDQTDKINSNKSDEKGEEETEKENQQLIQSMIAVGIPAIAACIVEPLLTVVDTLFVGRYAMNVNQGVIDLAAMSINGAIFNVLAAATASLCTGTTALVSRAQGKLLLSPQPSLSSSTNNNNNHNNNSNKMTTIGADTEKNVDINITMTTISSSNQVTTTKAVIPAIHKESYDIFETGMIVSIFLGIFVNIISSFSMKSIMTSTFHPDTAVLNSALSYFMIRIVSFPFTLINYIIVGFSLGTQNIIAPMISIMTSFFINVFGDYIFIKIFNMGLVGAAIATSISSIIGTTIASTLILKDKNINKNTLENTDNSIRNDNIIQRLWISFRKKCNIHIIKQLFSTSGALLAGSLLSTSTYSSGAKISSTVKSRVISDNVLQTPISSISSQPSPVLMSSINSITTSTGATNTLNLQTIHVAAHQVAMQSWWFLSYFSSPLCLIAQSLLPREIEAKNIRKANKLVSYLIKAAYLVAGMMTGINTLISLYATPLFTPSHIIQQTVKSITFQSSTSQFIICLTTALDGIFIGSKFIQKYVIACFLSTSSAWIYYIYSIYKGKGLRGAWNGLLIFGIVRLLYYCTQWKSVINRINHIDDISHTTITNGLNTTTTSTTNIGE